MNRSQVQAVSASVATGVLTLSTQAHAALPAGVTTAITDAGADMVTAVTAIIVAFVAFWGLRKLGSKFGWI
jgi:hypothetical protein